MNKILQKIVRLFSNQSHEEHRSSKQVLHFLHIGKTGGTAIKFALSGISELQDYDLKLHRHRVRLRNIPEGEKVMFFVRDPIDRFISGFYSRQRQGAPRYSNPWSPAEEVAFSQFPTVNELAVALSSPDATTKEAAVEAMKSIGHVRSSYWDWFDNEEYLLSRLSDIFFIGFQERIPADFELLRHKIALPPEAQLPTDDTAAHRSPKGLDRHLDSLAIENLREWYCRDYSFVNFCRSRAEAINQANA